MITITTTVELYDFEELDERAKARAADALCGAVFVDFFSSWLRDDLAAMLPNSSPEFSYSLANCQGDGLDVTGALDVGDMCELAGIPRIEAGAFRARSLDCRRLFRWDSPYVASDLAELMAEERAWCAGFALDAAWACCRAMQRLCDDYEQAGYAEIDHYSEPEAHVGMLYEKDGSFWGWRDALAQAS